MGAVVELRSRQKRLSQLARMHIFCVPCAEKTGLSTAPRDQRRCPVCKTDLPNAHDAVRNLVNPPEDFKTSVLCGLDPATIMECTQRALSFWTYQNAQEHAYQQHIARNLMQRYHQLNAEVERIVNDANTRIQALETQNQELTADRHSMDQKYAQLFDQYQEKSKKQAQTQKLYDILKQKVMLEKMQPLADDDVAQTLQSMDALPHTKKEQPIIASRQAVYPPEPLNIPQRSIPDYGRLQEGPGRLHPHQRSGSSVSGSEQRGMLPPERPRISRISNLVTTSGTPLQRVALPAHSRLGVNQAGVPATGSRSQLPASHHLPGWSRRQNNHSSKVKHTTRNYSPIISGMKVGRAGTSGSLGLGPRFSEYAVMPDPLGAH
ncbi:uncharacterized protein A1O5_01444 [Cladophialophora psammophila CBS 110553]|uniref:E3 ubiquitin-protein ligase CCNB1IP1 n=1 Tax=Cladophialophora psammophila CBS 110553 TaxID=1182543 RepID=W9XWV6_9EURO|nr:uncharacterized protein A1O5_01444 [Cladophialophora psammophila CBS 110553]EXJ74749.1 hypothetical protein A1O5_01444 [Cladophialophora psammophila CBS 110553]